jgi:hypothetical protein
MRRYRVALTTHAGWHCAVETPSFLPAVSPRTRAAAYLALHLAFLRCHRLREPSEQSRRYGDVLACPGEVWETIIVLDDSSMHIAGLSVHLIMVLCDLMLEHHALLLQMESRGFKLPQLLP